MPENPLSIEDAKIVSQAARILKILISNAQLYSPKSQLVKDGISTLLKLLDPYISAKGKISFSESEKNLIIDGQILKTEDKSGAAFVENMVQCGLKSITFLNGITGDEITALVENMSVKKKELRKDLTAALKEKGFTHIAVNQKVYVALDDEEKITRKDGKPSAEQAADYGETGSIVTGEDDGQSADNLGQAEIITGPSIRMNIMEQAAKAVSGEKKELIKKEKNGEIIKMLKDLDGIDRSDLAGQVVDRVAENLYDKEKKVRLETVRSFKQLHPTIKQLSDKNIINSLDEHFLASEERETEEDVYGGLADLLEDSANRNVAEGNYNKAIQITKMFRLHKYAKDEGFENRAVSADKILKKLANSGLVDILVADLRSEDQKKKEEAYKVVASLDEYAVFYLINTMKDIEDIHLRRIIGFLIKNLGDSAVKLLCESITPEISTEEALRILEVLDSVEYYDVVFDELKEVYIHYNADVKKGVLDLLAKIKPDRIKELLIFALEDYDPRIVKEAVKLCGKVKAVEMSGRLASIIAVESVFSKKKSDPVIEEEACIALGKIRDKTSIKMLVKVVESGGFLKFKKEKPLSVRIAGLNTLAAFSSLETREIINKFTAHSDKNIARAAKEALLIQERAYEKKGAAESRRFL